MKKLIAFLLCLSAFFGIYICNRSTKRVEAQIKVLEDVSESPDVSSASPSTDNTLENVKQVQPKSISVNVDGVLTDMDLEDYIICVVAGEISPNNPEEALKAQAVAARTYLFHKMEGGGCNGGGDICADYKHCQAYKSVDKMKSDYGNKFDEYFAKISRSVLETAGEYVCYGEKPICALYHSSSKDKTENCISVFGGSYPYLVSVSTNETSEDKAQSFSKDEFCTKINEFFGMNISDFDIKIETYTDADRVSSLMIGGNKISATKLRSCLGLRSTDFTFEVNSDTITFYCLGYGHGVGMSQAGACQMAQDGCDYKKILLHYYPGTSIAKK